MEIIVRIVWIMLMVMMMRVQMMMGIVVLMMMIMEWIVSMVMIAVVGDGIRDAIENIECQVAGRASVYMQISTCAFNCRYITFADILFPIACTYRDDTDDDGGASGASAAYRRDIYEPHL